MQAHCGEKNAIDTLSPLADGPKGSEARAQLALIAVQQNKLEDADFWLKKTHVDVPGVRYAMALVHARNGKVAQMQELLCSDKGK